MRQNHLLAGLKSMCLLGTLLYCWGRVSFWSTPLWPDTAAQSPPLEKSLLKFRTAMMLWSLSSRFSFIPNYIYTKLYYIYSKLYTFSCTFQPCRYVIGPITILHHLFQLLDTAYMLQSTSLSEILTYISILERQRRQWKEIKFHN